MGNEEPVFIARNLVLDEPPQIMKEEHIRMRVRMIGSRADARRTSSQRSPGQPLDFPCTDFGNRAASGRHRSQLPTSM